jgi:hypothetical protein
MSKTDIQANVGKHAFELAGLGLAPFRFTGASDNVITYPDGTSKPGSSCDFCGTGIRTECWVTSADNRQFKVGCNCIEKVGDKGLLKAYKNSPEFRAKAAAIRQAKATAVFNELNDLIRDNAGTLTDLPHPRGFTDFETGKPLTRLDHAIWMKSNCGATGRQGLLKSLKLLLGKS